MEDIDQSVINYTRHESLKQHRSNTDYKFREISVPVETISNNGIIGEFNFSSDFLPENVYLNKCFFIALSQGLKKINFDLDPLDLMQLCGFMDQFDMVDTDKPDHKLCLERLVSILNFTQVHVYIGEQKEDKWYVSPDHFNKFGQGQDVIRILNKGRNLHFELMVTDANMFPRDIKTMTNEKAFEHQNEIMKQIEQIKSDYIYALSFEGRND